MATSLGCDGYIAHIFEQSLANSLLNTNRPVVNVSGVLSDLPFCRVVADHAEVGRLAARHLLDRGLTELAFVGYPAHEFSVRRQSGFEEIAKRNSVHVSSFLERTRRIEEPNGLWKWNKSLHDWLKALPRPIGILASHDIQGVQLSEYCHQLNFHVPEDVAIVGVDDDDLLCELSRPSLSSVALPSERIGYEAAKLLDELLHSRSRVKRSIILPPGGVVVRQSSDVQAVRDADVAEAVRYIRENSHRPIQVADVLRAVPLARRSLERRFRKWLQRSILDEISCAHVEHARKLLISTNRSMASIAIDAGFRDSRHLSILFRKLMTITPSEYRRQFRLRS